MPVALAVLDSVAVTPPARTAALIAQPQALVARFVLLVVDGFAIMTLAFPPLVVVALIMRW
jgi:hypothetical protein